MTGEPINRVLVVGAGSWGTTVAHLLAQKGLDVALWAREQELAACIARRRENPRYLPGIALSPNLRIAFSLPEAVAEADLLVYAIPAQSLRAVVRDTQPYIADRTIILNLAKGIEAGSGARC